MNRRLPLLLVLVSLAACGRGEKPAEEKAGLLGRLRGKPHVTVMTLASREVPLVLNITGKTVVADRFEARAPSEVKIERIFVEEGQRVAAGDALVSFDDERSRLEMERARAEIREAEAGLAEVNYLLDNRETLVEEGKLTEVEAGGLDERVDMYEATIDRARAEIEVLENFLENTQIASSIPGIVTKRGVTEGNMVATDDFLIEVARIDPMHFIFSVPVEAAPALQIGREIEAGFPSQKEKTLLGEILSVGAEATPEGVEVKVKFANETGLLKGDLEGKVTIRTDARTRILPVPPSAIVKTERSTYIFTVKDGKVRRVAVELGDEYAGQPTLAKGPKEGETIVVGTTAPLKDGQPVEVETAR